MSLAGLPDVHKPEIKKDTFRIAGAIKRKFYLARSSRPAAEA
jgi:hypothetical protein